MAFEEPRYKFLTVGPAATPVETGTAATTHLGVPLPTSAVSMSPAAASRGGYPIDPTGYNPSSWFQDTSGKWFYTGDPSMKKVGGQDVPTQNSIEFRVKGQGSGGTISPPGGWGASTGAISENPFIGTPSNPFAGVMRGGRMDWSTSPPPPFIAPPTPPQIPITPNPQETPIAPQNVPTDQGITYPTDLQQYLPSTAGANIPTADQGVSPAPFEQYLPSESLNVPTDQGVTYPTGTDQYRADAPLNLPTQETGVIPTGPNEYLPSQGFNVPTDQAFVYPTTAPDAFQPSTAGANIPTSENPTATLAPDAFRPADQSFYYPAGDGTYTNLDSNGNEIPTGRGVTPDVLPATPVPEDLPFGTFGTPTGNPSVGGAFMSPPGGAIGGPLGAGSHGVLPWFQRLVMAGARRGNPSLGLGAGSAPALAAAAYSPGVLAAQAPSWQTIAPYVSANQGFAGDTATTAGEAADARRGIGGPGGRAMSAQ